MHLFAGTPQSSCDEDSNLEPEEDVAEIKAPRIKIPDRYLSNPMNEPDTNTIATIDTVTMLTDTVHIPTQAATTIGESISPLNAPDFIFFAESQRPATPGGFMGGTDDGRDYGFAAMVKSGRVIDDGTAVYTFAEEESEMAATADPPVCVLVFPRVSCDEKGILAHPRQTPAESQPTEF